MGERRVVDDIGRTYDIPCGLHRGGLWRCVADSSLIWDLIPDWIEEDVRFYGYVRYRAVSNEQAYATWVVGDIDIPEIIVPRLELDEGVYIIYLSKDDTYIWDTVFEIILRSEILGWGVGLLSLSREF
ncbi:MAG: hypothetical protein QXM53_06690 [Thermofilaceae archaeon]